MTTPVNNSLAPQVQQWLHRVIAPVSPLEFPPPSVSVKCIRLTAARCVCRNMPIPNGPTMTLLQRSSAYRHCFPEQRSTVRHFFLLGCGEILCAKMSPVQTAHEDGRSQLLLNVHGTIPVIFRGATYNIPLTVWLPHQYPRQPPVAFVTPARDMLIRPGNHVDPNGRCYHPYLANWVNFSDVCVLHNPHWAFGAGAGGGYGTDWVG